MHLEFNCTMYVEIYVLLTHGTEGGVKRSQCQIVLRSEQKIPLMITFCVAAIELGALE